jgi:hypothetical protein
VLTSNTQFEHELHKLIDVEINRIQGVLGAGQAVKDIADYRYIIGQIHALERVKTYCDEVNTTLSQR